MRRGQILSCAVRCFGERPYAEVSTTDIAREAGVARGLINHYFGTKKDLYLEVIRVMVTIPEVAVEALPEGDLRTRVEASVSWFLDVVSRHSTSWLAAISAAGPGRDADVERVLAEAEDIAADSVLIAVGLADGSGMSGARGGAGLGEGPAGARGEARLGKGPAGARGGSGAVGIGAVGDRAAGAGTVEARGAGRPVGGEVGHREELRGIFRAYVALARATAGEWLRRGVLTRGQVQVLLVTTLMAIVEDVVPEAIGNLPTDC